MESWKIKGEYCKVVINSDNKSVRYKPEKLTRSACTSHFVSADKVSDQ